MPNDDTCWQALARAVDLRRLQCPDRGLYLRGAPMKTTTNHRSKLRQEIEDLTREIAEDHAISLDAARQLARQALPQLAGYAQTWDQLVIQTWPYTPATA